MEFLGVGPLELLFILLIALILLGPSDMVKAGRTLARIVRQVITSEGWRSFMQASNQIRTLPNEFLRDAGLDEVQQQLQQTINQTRKIAEDTQKDLQIGSISTPNTIDSPPAPSVETEKSEAAPSVAESISEEDGSARSSQPIVEESDATNELPTVPETPPNPPDQEPTSPPNNSSSEKPESD